MVVVCIKPTGASTLSVLKAMMRLSELALYIHCLTEHPNDIAA
jgi:hypothetical protein